MKRVSWLVGSIYLMAGLAVMATGCNEEEKELISKNAAQTTPAPTGTIEETTAPAEIPIEQQEAVETTPVLSETIEEPAAPVSDNPVE